MEELTKKQSQILDFIRKRIDEGGVAPTLREIGKAFGITSTNGVHQHVSSLIRKGYLKKGDYLARSLQLPGAQRSAVRRLPLVGSVPAGGPIDAIENRENEIVVDESFAPKGESFSLKVTGDSMKNAGIEDGDIVIVRKQQTAQKGDIIVAIIGNEATVKRYMPDGKQIVLQPENEDYKPIIVTASSPDFRIAGKVVSLIRSLG